MLVKTLQENKTRVLCPQFLENTELFLGCPFVLLSGAADRCVITSDYSSLLAGGIQSNV